ncbi:2-oxoglutarate ferredoxin oxidoreductase, gamma subunit [Desulfocicer vacuolatum DSM 3385]|uniref:2-oxoglutarate ferredoxin oxidoreductase, gamma subunit n=1 Tax=Desulfocicer vacuolatum DSM 3385 TaxID=1121400 RepID=A0A1W2CQP8_9BACT|nr:2-oxoacid:acceptor oxidoreductase family protein [Desulfocicer vacuolatum]SMC87523.1 2-oxoglutarate ferredoxin oxidoreductase, gamma subunit [Desulfocicer vacuolatum DSM 3385]
MKRTRLIFSGSGGQGVITAAIILAEAAVIHEGKNATQSQSYGAAARGGSTRSDVIISDEDIMFPEVNQANTLVCLTQESYNTYKELVRPGGIVITDSRFVTTTKKVDAKQIELPMYQTVMDKIGKPIVFNVCMLGAVLGVTEILKPPSVMDVLKSRVPEDFIEMNRKALDLGMDLGALRAV